MDEHWLDGIELDDNLKTDNVIRRFGSLEDALKSIPEAKAYQGRSISLPPEDATPEMWSEFDTKLMGKVPGLIRRPTADDADDRARFMRDIGMPEEATGYKKPEDLDIPDEMLAELTQIAFTTGLTQQQYEAFVNTYAAANGEHLEQAKIAEQEANEIISKKWGAAKEDNDSIAQTLFQKFGDDDHPVDIENVPVPIRLMMAKMAKALTSDPQIFNQVQAVTTKKTPGELRNRIEQIFTLLKDDSVKGDKRKKLLTEQSNAYDELARYG